MEKILIIQTFTSIVDNKTDILKYCHNKGGIYQFKNSINNKSYIGSSIKLNRRFLEHLSISHRTSTLSRSRSLLYNAFFKYGINNFIFNILEII